MGPKTLQKDTNVYLIGHYEPQVVGTRLPSNRQVLSVLFYNLRHVKLSLTQSAKLAIKETVVFWEKYHIPIRQKHKCELKLKSLYNEWRLLQKSKSRKSDKTNKNERLFVTKLDNLFDIAHANALNIITIEEVKAFLINQRKPGRVSCFARVDAQLQRVEKQAEQ